MKKVLFVLMMAICTSLFSSFDGVLNNVLKQGLEQAREGLPMQIDEGLVMDDITLGDNGIVYHITVSEELYDMDILDDTGTVTANQITSEASREQPTTGTVNGYYWVDLGLSVKWATKNVGASSPSDYGYYFAWGETEPKSRYDWDNCFDCLDSTGDSWGTYKIDGKTSISPTSGHDTARENWGGTWRMPTIAEFEELRKKCVWTWTSQGGHNGYLVTSKTNGNSIFLPAAGWRGGSNSYNVGECGYYLSSALSSSNSDYARYLGFSISDHHYTNDGLYRMLGQSVRPVTE